MMDKPAILCLRNFCFAALLILLYLAAAFIPTVAHTQASDRFVDVYGASNAHAAFILKQYAPIIYETETAFIRGIQQSHCLKNDTQSTSDLCSESSSTQYLPQDLNKNSRALLERQRERLKMLIKNRLNLAYVNFDSVAYLEGKIYITVEVIEKKDRHRLKLLTSAAEKPYSIPAKKDVIDEMLDYINIGADLYYAQSQSFDEDQCPVYHCTFGFKHPALHPYLARFNQAALKERAFILRTLKNDPFSERRAAAAFLIGHFVQAQDIIHTLLPYVNDRDAGVRNNVIRVIGETMRHSHYSNVDVRPFVRLLQSPYETDRNKSMLVLLGAVSSPKQRAIIHHSAHPWLIRLSQLKQPNNRNFAQLLLKQVQPPVQELKPKPPKKI